MWENWHIALIIFLTLIILPLLNSFSGSKNVVVNDVNITVLSKEQMAHVFSVMQVAGFDSAASQGFRCYPDSTNGRRSEVEDLSLMFTLADYISGPIWLEKWSFRILLSGTCLQQRAVIHSWKTYRNRKTSRSQRPKWNLQQAQPGEVVAEH